MKAGLYSAAVGVAMATASGNANAGDSLHPRTAVLWDDVVCMQHVDRSVDANYPLSYAIPYEDTEVTSDEVEGSRTHQFFATCRQTYLQEDLPGWISMADVEATRLIDEDFAIPPDDEILERASHWNGCWHRINEDTDRRPITEAMASQPVIWDTSAVPSGVYVLHGYTYEPPFNLWAPRAGGVVRVHDGGDPAMSGPAAAITTGQELLCANDTVRIEGCVSALPGTTMSAWFTTNPSPDLADSIWTPFAEDLPVQGESFTLDWKAAPEASGLSTILRVDFTDPNGVTYTAYQYAPMIVLSDHSAGCADEPVDCTASLETDSSCDNAITDGAGCRLSGARGAGWGALWLLGLFALRRRTAPFRHQT